MGETVVIYVKFILDISQSFLKKIQVTRLSRRFGSAIAKGRHAICGCGVDFKSELRRNGYKHIKTTCEYELLRLSRVS